MKTRTTPNEPTMTKRQAQAFRTALKRGGFVKTDTGHERGQVWTKWELRGVANVIVGTTYSLATGRTNENGYTVTTHPAITLGGR